jgi:hypothetical protein
MANEREKAAKGVDSVTDYVDVREDASLAGGVAALSSSSSSSSADRYTHYNTYYVDMYMCIYMYV